MAPRAQIVAEKQSFKKKSGKVRISKHLVYLPIFHFEKGGKTNQKDDLSASTVVATESLSTIAHCVRATRHRWYIAEQLWVSPLRYQAGRYSDWISPLLSGRFRLGRANTEHPASRSTARGEVKPYRSEIPVHIRVLADVLVGDVSPLQKMLVSFVLRRREGAEILSSSESW